MHIEITNENLERLAQMLDLDSGDVRRDYSGRGMYGASCVGLVVDVPDVVIGVALREIFDEDEAWELARAACSDSMGRSTIVYFPGLVVAQDEDEDEEVDA